MSIPKPDLELEDLDKPDPFVADCVDPGQVRSWILDCEEKHGVRCNTTEHQSATLATELKLIDVVNRCIVDAPPNVRYFALSYMWGGVTQMLLTTENGAELSLAGSLQRHWSIIPTVIQDAIHFVAAINEKYLWVDSLCIVQNDIKMKHHQILQMGAIYNGAVASLVGAVGTNANSGLAGVRSHTRTPEQRRLQYQNVYLVNPGPEEYTSLRKPWDSSPYIKMGRRMKARQLDLNERLMNSNYSSRAWTYQERILSRRCIYFMENMVYYHCRSAIRGENKATPYSQNSQNIRPLCLFMADPIFSGDVLRHQRTLGAIYAGIVTEFTSKKLSFPLDVLDAFSGISSAMEKLCSWRFVAGMPESLLDYALLWTPPESSQRRCQQPDNPFPSWSWVGWCTRAEYDTVFRTDVGFEPYLANMESFITRLIIYDQDGLRWIQGSVPVNEHVAKLATEAGGSLHRELSVWLSRISSSQMPKNVLLFPALTWPFRDCEIVRPGTQGPALSLTRPSLGPIKLTGAKFQFHFLIYGAHASQYEGYLFGVGEEILSMRQQSNYDIVFLSISKEVGEDFENWNHSSSKTNIMLIKWTGDFAERVAIGQIDGLLSMESRGHFSDGRYITGNEAEDRMDHRLKCCYWKTIRLV